MHHVSSLAELCSSHEWQRMIRAITHSFPRLRHEEEEVRQELLVKLAARGEDYVSAWQPDRGCSLKQWVGIAVRNHCIKADRRHRTRAGRALRSALTIMAEPAAEDVGAISGDRVGDPCPESPGFARDFRKVVAVLEERHPAYVRVEYCADGTGWDVVRCRGGMRTHYEGVVPKKLWGMVVPRSPASVLVWLWLGYTVPEVADILKVSATFTRELLAWLQLQPEVVALAKR